MKEWLDTNNIGTVHTFQGQGTDEVIFLLGCDKTSVSAANWVNKNIVNVAATRAKFRFYIIGDKSVWGCKPVKVARELTAEIMTVAELDETLSGTAAEKAAAADAESASRAASLTLSENSTDAASSVLPTKTAATGAPAYRESKTPSAAPAYPKSRTSAYSSTKTEGGKNANTAKIAPAAKQIICSKCGKPMEERNGKFGKFLGCTGFPKCRNTEKIR